MNRTKIEYLDIYEKGWIEAAIDGEGALCLIKQGRSKYRAGFTYEPRVDVANKSTAFLEKAKKICRGGAISNPRKNGLRSLDMSSNLLRTLLPQIQLVAKERQRLLLLEALDILSRHVSPGKPRNDEELRRLEAIHVEITQLNGGRFSRTEQK